MFRKPNLNDPTDKLAHTISELHNDNAPIGWETYRPLASALIRKLGIEHAVMQYGTTPKYGKDHGQKITVGEIINQLNLTPDPDEFRDKIDELFFNGAWPSDTAGSAISEDFKRDVAGLLFAAIHRHAGK